MNKTDKALCRLSALIVPAWCALNLIGAPCAGQETATRINPPRTTQQPYTEEFRDTTVYRSLDGSTSTPQQEDQLTSKDSQGRSVTATTQLANGVASYLVYDPVAGTRTVWNSRSKQAKMLIYPTPVVGRVSCWRYSPLQDQNVGREELRMGGLRFSCLPAGERQSLPYCAHGKAVEPPPDYSPEVKETYNDCLTAVNSVIVPGKISEKDEDLGVETIQGFQAQGCRVTTIATDGKHVSEYWFNKFGTGRRNWGFVLRSAQEFPGSPKRSTIGITREVAKLILGEPDPAVFLPPKDYEVKPVLMHEVPCETASNPAVDAADSH